MTAAPMDTLFDALIEFLAASPTTAEIIAYEPPPELQERLSMLLDKNRTAGLTPDERAELDEFLRINRFVSRLKLKARQHLSA